MHKLLTYLNSLPKESRPAFAAKCGTTEGYLRKAISAQQRLGAALCVNIERESDGVVRCEDLRPDVDWGFLRGSEAKCEGGPPPDES